MKGTVITTAFLLTFAAFSALAQSPAERVYATERAFEKAAAEKGTNAAFVEFMAADGIMFVPDAANAREYFSKLPPSTGYLTWNPEIIDVSSNGVLAFSIGNSIFRPKGKDDSTAMNGHYLSIWRREGDGNYRAVLDTGIRHANPGLINSTWKSPPGVADPNAGKISASDSSTRFYELAAEDVGKAYSRFAADDAVALRSGVEPAVGRKQFRDLVGKAAGTVRFSKRKSFLEAGDLAYVHGPYTIVDKGGKEIEKGNFVQVWKLRKGAWQIVADVLSPMPSK
jgi:ketosteroid isomerase-like protein